MGFGVNGVFTVCSYIFLLLFGEICIFLRNNSKKPANAGAKRLLCSRKGLSPVPRIPRFPLLVYPKKATKKTACAAPLRLQSSLFAIASLPLRHPHALCDRLIHGPELFLMAQEQVGQHRIKVAAPAFPDNAGAFFMGEGLFIHSLGPQRVVYIGQGHDAG